MGNTPDIIISIQQLTGGGHEEICDKNVGHDTKMVGSHRLRVSIFKARVSQKDSFIMIGISSFETSFMMNVMVNVGRKGD